MDEDVFRKYLRKSGRSKNATNRVIILVNDFQDYLSKLTPSKGLDSAQPRDLEAFTSWVESEPKTSAKIHLWGIWYYYDFTSNPAMAKKAATLRQDRIKRKPLALKKFRGIDLNAVSKLEAKGITDVKQMLAAGDTPQKRETLAKQTNLPLETIVEFVKLSDLARIPGVKNIRARLYYDAGVDTLEKLAQWNPQEFREMLIQYVEKTQFNGIAPLPKEAQYTVNTAKSLPKRVTY
ncbi:MAG: DUF4332 domain-containing protein [Candidatus Ranarchaeia archaeon]|jgi:predicted flap endonuclease-1-like 5' DNA nuclease